MSMLGAQLEDLSALSQRLTTTSGDVGTARVNSLAATTNVISSVSDAAQRALSEITSHMEQLEASVTASTTQADATNWTGANADRFRGAAGDFHSSMTRGQSATTQAFEAFRAAVATMSETLEGYVNEFGAALTGAEQAAGQMSAAVEGQRANLDQVMNQGLSVS